MLYGTQRFDRVQRKEESSKTVNMNRFREERERRRRSFNEDNDDANSQDDEQQTLNQSIIAVNMEPDGSYKSQQSALARSMVGLPLNPSYEMFQKRVSQLSWLTKTRFDLLAAVKKLNTLGPRDLSGDNVRLLNDTLLAASSNVNRGVFRHRLDRSTFQLVVFTSTSFINSLNYSVNNSVKPCAQMAFVVFLVDDSNRANWLRCANFETELSKMLTNINLYAETFAFLVALEYTLSVRRELEKIIKRSVTLYMMTDCIEICRILSGFMPLSESNQILESDFKIIRDACERDDIQDIGLIDSSHNIAASFKDENARCKPLEELLDSGLLKLHVSEWAIRQYDVVNVNNTIPCHGELGGMTSNAMTSNRHYSEDIVEQDWKEGAEFNHRRRRPHQQQ